MKEDCLLIVRKVPEIVPPVIHHIDLIWMGTIESLAF
jgi:hypothetical protein